MNAEELKAFVDAVTDEGTVTGWSLYDFQTTGPKALGGAGAARHRLGRRRARCRRPRASTAGCPRRAPARTPGRRRADTSSSTSVCSRSHWPTRPVAPRSRLLPRSRPAGSASPRSAAMTRARPRRTRWSWRSPSPTRARVLGAREPRRHRGSRAPARARRRCELARPPTMSQPTSRAIAALSSAQLARASRGRPPVAPSRRGRRAPGSRRRACRVAGLLE